MGLKLGKKHARSRRKMALSLQRRLRNSPAVLVSFLHLAKIDFKKLSGKKWRKPVLIGLAVVFGAGLLVQIAYPNDRMLPLAVVDGMYVGGMKKSDASARLDEAYRGKTMNVLMGKQDKAFVSPTLADAGIEVTNRERLDGTQYEWYKRLLPLSLLWGQTPGPVPEPQFTDKTDKFIDEKLMPACRQAPVNATLSGKDGELTVVPAKDGGQCEKPDVETVVRDVRPVLNEEAEVRVTALKVIEPELSDSEARALRDAFRARIGEKISLKAGNQMVDIPARDLITWLDFSVDGKTITPSVNRDRSAEFIAKQIAPKVEKKPGVSKVTTVDFTEVSRVEGASGVAVNIDQTLQSIADVVSGANKTGAVAVTQPVPPTVQYTRTYSASDAGLSALLENYAKDHPGTYGVSLAELSGKKRRANYNGDKQFVTASTYKLFVGYSVLKRTESGKMDWGANADCFNKMISLSDNPCAENFLQTAGLSNVTNEMKALGLNDSTFMKSGGPFTTANDLAKFMGFLESGTSLTGVSRERMLNALHANVHRRGIPSGAAGRVADKVGFMNGLLHDAAVVYGPRGTYVLAIMSDGSSWATLADFARQIDAQLAKE